MESGEEIAYCGQRRLGHRREPEHRVRPYGRVAIDAQHTEGALAKHALAISGDRHNAKHYPSPAARSSSPSIARASITQHLHPLVVPAG